MQKPESKKTKYFYRILSSLATALIIAVFAIVYRYVGIAVSANAASIATDISQKTEKRINERMSKNEKRIEVELILIREQTQQVSAKLDRVLFLMINKSK